MNITPYDIALRFVGMKEIPGVGANPAVLAMLRLDDTWPEGDETPWCSAFVNYVAWLLRLPRSKSLAARSWLSVGDVVPLVGTMQPTCAAVRGFDVVILERGAGGHVGFFSAFEQDRVWLLGGNQGDAVSVASFDKQRILGVRRLRSA